jgi:hypothetical protein
MQDHKRGFSLARVVCLVLCLDATFNGLAAEPAPPLTVTSIDDTDVSAIWRSGSGWQDFSGLGKTHYKGTAMSCQQPGDAFVCGNSACTRIRWFATKSTDRGMADVYEGGLLMFFSPAGKKEDLVAVERYRVGKRHRGLYLRLVVDTKRGWLTAYLNGRVLKRWPYKLLND